MAHTWDARPPGAIIDDAFDRIEAAEGQLQEDFQNIGELRRSVGRLLDIVEALTDRVQELEQRVLPVRQLEEHRQHVADCLPDLAALRAELEARGEEESSDESE